MIKVIILLLSVLIACLACYFNYFNPFQSFLTDLLKSDTKVRLFTADELKEYDGIRRPELFLSILGKIYNVTKGEKHYGPSQTYHVFVGRDSSRSFVNGKFTQSEASDLVTDFSDSELRSLNHWRQFYKKDYQFVGKLIGRYYDSHGNPTQYSKIVKKSIKKALKAEEDDQLRKLQFPPCNVEWDAKSGSRVWCTKRSGGIDRDWVGVPRQLFEPENGSYRCACVNEANAKLGTVKEYEGCDTDSTSCFVMS